MSFSISKINWSRANLIHAALWTVGIVILFAIYTFGIGHNPPGFYVDESALCYNAYLVEKTGAGEFGAKWPLFFQVYTGGFTQYSNPTQIYLLAGIFWLFGPGILIARLLAAASMFAASLFAGLLGAKLSGRQVIGVIVGVAALVTPWLFEVGRLALETFFYPMAIMLFLWALYLAYRKGEWRWFNIVAIALALMLITYSYTIGRMLGPLLAFGLISFAVNRKQIIAVGATWVAYGLTLIPLVIFNRNNPGLTTRFYLLSYIKPTSTYGEIISKFVERYFQDLNPIRMLFTGDTNQRHHIPDALGSMFIGVLLIALLGLIMVIVQRRRDAWWRYIAVGLAASVVPGALTVDVFHTLRMIAFPVFLYLMMVPALEWLLGTTVETPVEEPKLRKSKKAAKIAKLPRPSFLSPRIRQGILAASLVLTLAEAGYFHWKYYLEGPKRGYAFDAAYKVAYDAAVQQPQRPIYLLDSYWGPAYMHSFWYATIEGRNTSEFIHLDYGKRPPSGSIVISSEQTCPNCDMIGKAGTFLFYRER